MTTGATVAVEVDEFEAGEKAVENGEDYAFGACPEWQQGFKDAWYRMNRQAMHRDPDGIETDKDWDAYLDSL